MNIYKIALTGGPCAGKTTVLNNITKLLEKEDYYVITVPETATNLIKNGAPPLEGHDHQLCFQDLVLDIQIFNENTAKAYCDRTLKTVKEHFKGKKGIIILCDRGILDNRAYLSQEDFDSMLERHNLNELELLQSYDLVIDLVSLATIDKDLYKLNGIRYETAEEAAIKDSITTSAWLLHPNLKIVKPTNTIKEKIKLVYTHIMLSINNIDTKEKIIVNPNKLDIPFNKDNSKASTKTYYYLNHPNNKKYTLVHTTYQNHETYTINTTPRINISEETFLNLYKQGLLEVIKEEVIIDFIQNGNHYQQIKSNDIDETYLIQDNLYKLSKVKIPKKTRRK